MTTDKAFRKFLQN